MRDGVKPRIATLSGLILQADFNPLCFESDISDLGIIEKWRTGDGKNGQTNDSNVIFHFTIVPCPMVKAHSFSWLFSTRKLLFFPV